MDSISFREIALTIGGLAAAYYFLLPLAVRLRMRGDVEIVPFDPEGVWPTPTSLSGHFEETDRSFSAIGFRRLASLALPHPMQNVSMVVVIYINEQSGDTASVTEAIGGPSGSIRIVYVEFTSEFCGSSPRLLETNNNWACGTFATVPEKLRFRFPHIRDVAYLYRLHQSLVRRHAYGLRKTLRVIEEFRGDAVAYLRQAMIEEYQMQETTGYLRRVEADLCWRPTLKGTYLMVWIQLWPIKQIRGYIMRRKAARLERELGVGS